MRHMGEPKTKLKPSEAYAELRRLERVAATARRDDAQHALGVADARHAAAERYAEWREFERKLLDGDFD